jgi:hypothetical protein
MDFEEALGNAWQNTFPGCSIMRDLFHLQQANTRRAGQIGLSHAKKQIITDIEVLWYADTKAEFDSRLDAFLTKWDEDAPQYSDYFRRVWIRQHPPETWASYARGKDAPSGVINSFSILSIASLTICFRQWKY